MNAKIFSLAVLLGVLAGGPSFGATLRVPQDYSSIQDAVAASVAGDTILVSPGFYVLSPVPSTLLSGNDCLELHDGTSLVGAGPSETFLSCPNAVGIVPLGSASVKLLRLEGPSPAIFAYIASDITVKNVIIANPQSTGDCVGIELDQGNSYTVYNTTIDLGKEPVFYTASVWCPSGTSFGIDVPFTGSADIQNNVVVRNDHAFTAGSLSGGTYAYNDAFGSTITDWATCDASGCTATSAPPGNISADPLNCPDYTLRPGSPAIHTGNPGILNPDGTRSDMGAYGGPDAIPPSLTVAPCAFDFGNVAVGKSGKVKAVLTNTSASGVTIRSSSSFFPNVFSVKPVGFKFPATIPPGASANVWVIFTPPQTGAFADDVLIFRSLNSTLETTVAITVKGQGVPH